jgi:TonB family protein
MQEVPMFDPKNRIHWVAVIIITLLLILALGVTKASGQEPDWPDVPSAQQDSHAWVCGEGPAYMPRDVEPRLTDAEALRQVLLSLQRAERPGAGGRTLLWVCVMNTGRVGGILIHTTSGDPILDSIALRAIANARFSPAKVDGRNTTVWIAQPVDFVPREEPVEL